MLQQHWSNELVDIGIFIEIGELLLRISVWPTKRIKSDRRCRRFDFLVVELRAFAVLTPSSAILYIVSSRAGDESFLCVLT